MSQIPSASGASEIPWVPDRTGGDRGLAPARTPDPGSRASGIIALIVLCIVVPLVIFVQQSGGEEKSQAGAPPTGPAAAATAQRLPEFDQFSIAGRCILKFSQLLTGADKDRRGELLEAIDPSKDGVVGTPSGGVLEQVRFAIAAGELRGGDDAITRLDAIDFDKTAEEWSPEPGLEGDALQAARAEHVRDVADLRHDADTLRLIYSGRETEIPAEDEARLVDRQGWWGRVATAFGKSDSDPMRLEALGGGAKLLAALVVFGVVIGGGILLGFAMAVVFLILVAQGKIRRKFVAPLPGGSVYLETLAVFVLGFAGLMLVKFAGGNQHVALLAQWLLVPLILWPLVRGVRWESFRNAVGFTSGGGVLREVGCGVFAYLAGIPLFLFAVFVAMLLVMLQSLVMYGPGVKPHAPNNKVLDLITQADLGTMVLFFCLATFWAPLVEESIFRGAMFRHLRSRVPMTIAAIGSAAVFGVMHGYPVPLLLPVMTLGFNFALMREWRGSLIAPMTAHMLHNGVLVGLMVTVMSAIR